MSLAVKIHLTEDSRRAAAASLYPLPLCDDPVGWQRAMELQNAYTGPDFASVDNAVEQDGMFYVTLKTETGAVQYAYPMHAIARVKLTETEDAE